MHLLLQIELHGVAGAALLGRVRDDPAVLLVDPAVEVGDEEDARLRLREGREPLHDGGWQEERRCVCFRRLPPLPPLPLPPLPLPLPLPPLLLLLGNGGPRDGRMRSDADDDAGVRVQLLPFPLLAQDLRCGVVWCCVV